MVHLYKIISGIQIAASLVFNLHSKEWILVTLHGGAEGERVGVEEIFSFFPDFKKQSISVYECVWHQTPWFPVGVGRIELELVYVCAKWQPQLMELLENKMNHYSHPSKWNFFMYNMTFCLAVLDFVWSFATHFTWSAIFSVHLTECVLLLISF